MIQKLQQLTNEISDMLLQAENSIKNAKNEIDIAYANGVYFACKNHIRKLTKILNEGSVAASELVDTAYWRGWMDRGESGG